jgi:hypothetical protein
MSNEGSKASFFRGKDKHQEIKTSLASSPRSKKQPSHLSFSEMFKRKSSIFTNNYTATVPERPESNLQSQKSSF